MSSTSATSGGTAGGGITSGGIASGGATNGGTTSSGAGETSQSSSGENTANKSSIEVIQTGTVFLNTLGTDMVDIHVGGGYFTNQRKHFRVHKNLLCSKIPFFDKMFNGGFKEAVEQVAYLTEDSPVSFDVLIDWVYTGKLRPHQYLIIESKVLGESWVLINLFMLVNRLCLFNLRGDVMDAYVESLKRTALLFPSCDELLAFWSLSGEGSVLQKFALLGTCWILHDMSRSKENMQAWPANGFLKLFKDPKFQLQYLEHVRSHPKDTKFEDPRDMPKCTFHHHGEGQPCPAKSSSQ